MHPIEHLCCQNSHCPEAGRVAPQTTVVMPPPSFAEDSSVWEVVRDAWEPPRVGEPRDDSTTRASTTDGRSTPTPSRAYAPATSVLFPLQPAGGDCRAPSRSCPHNPPRT